MTQDKMRAEFEEWVMRNPRAGTHLEKGRTGAYKDNRVAAKWSAWQAAQKREPLKAQAIKDIIRDTGFVTNSQAWELTDALEVLLAKHNIDLD